MFLLVRVVALPWREGGARPDRREGLNREGGKTNGDRHASSPLGRPGGPPDPPEMGESLLLSPNRRGRTRPREGGSLFALAGIGAGTLAGLDLMPVGGGSLQVTVQTEIDAPADAVFDYIADLSNNPNWQSGVETTMWTSPPPVAVGSTCEQTLDSGTVVEYVVTALLPRRSITIETRRGAVIPTTVTRTVQVLNEAKSRVRMDLTGHPRGWRRLTAPLVPRAIRGAIGSDYRRLKRVLEAAQTPEE